jgi:hypothetical protein
LGPGWLRLRELGSGSVGVTFSHYAILLAALSAALRAALVVTDDHIGLGD